MKVSLFATCLGDELYPDVAQATARVLERLGCEVEIIDRPVCCGQPAFNSGFSKDARRVAEAWLDAFSSADYIVSPSGSCAGMIRHNYEGLFFDDPKRLAQAKRLTARTYEFCQFLVEVLGIERLEASFPHSVTYHASCHAMRLLGSRDAPLKILRAVPDITLAPLPHLEDCCGFGGTFAVKLSGISAAMVDEKIDHIESTGARYVTSTDLGCLMNIAGRMERRGVAVTALHLADLVNRALVTVEERA